jgi:hypothetical protein
MLVALILAAPCRRPRPKPCARGGGATIVPLGADLLPRTFTFYFAIISAITPPGGLASCRGRAFRRVLPQDRLIGSHGPGGFFLPFISCTTQCSP